MNLFFRLQIHVAVVVFVGGGGGGGDAGVGGVVVLSRPRLNAGEFAFEFCEQPLKVLWVSVKKQTINSLLLLVLLWLL